MLRETDILRRLQAGELSLPPVQLRVLEIEPVMQAESTIQVDAFIEAQWQGLRLTPFLNH